MNLENYPDILTAKDLQSILQISRAGAYNLMNISDFPTILIGRSKRVMKSKLLDWLDNHTEKI
ncbi:MAG: helix-turn-helix domain-containing protein [Oscillospiraceae bacterium]|nr:helix-turn-helix domain-containing protein [Oscillospiraceae bacterium]